MLIGYVRGFSHELQLEALKQAQCQQIFQELESRTRTERPVLQQALDYLRPGDTLVIWRLDCLGRSLKHLIETVGQFEERGVGFKSLREAIDTTSSDGHLVFQIFGALVECQHNLIRERTLAGLAAARARGRNGGRPKKLDDQQTALLYQLYDEKILTLKEICHSLDISKQTLYTYLDRRQADKT